MYGTGIVYGALRCVVLSMEDSVSALEGKVDHVERYCPSLCPVLTYAVGDTGDSWGCAGCVVLRYGVGNTEASRGCGVLRKGMAAGGRRRRWSEPRLRSNASNSDLGHGIRGRRCGTGYAVVRQGMVGIGDAVAKAAEERCKEHEEKVQQ
eukprot:2037966-Rhodomonas_salina.1